MRKGLEIISALWGHTSGLAMPHLAVDAPGGGGKIPLFPQTVLAREGDRVVLRGYTGEVSTFPDPGEAVGNPFHL